jgi:hypothetical protein
LLLAKAAVEQRSESLVSTFGVDDPRPQLERRLVTYVPLMPHAGSATQPPSSSW